VEIIVAPYLLATSAFFNSTSKSAITIKVDGSTYLLYHNGGRFVTGKEEATGLSEVIYIIDSKGDTRTAGQS